VGEVGSAVVRTTEGVTGFHALLSHMKREGMILRACRISTISGHGRRSSSFPNVASRRKRHAPTNATNAEVTDQGAAGGAGKLRSLGMASSTKCWNTGIWCAPGQ
jgi:hypothetical protein